MTRRTSGTYEDTDGTVHTWEQQSLLGQWLQLHADSWRIAALVGLNRHHHCATHGITDRNAPDQGRSVEQHVLAAVAELAVAMELGVAWPATSSRPAADRERGDLVLPIVGATEVRSTTPHYAGEVPALRVRPRDDMDRPYVLCVGPIRWHEDHCSVRCAGWAWGRDVKLERYWKGDSWLVPQDELTPLASLKRWSEGKGS